MTAALMDLDTAYADHIDVIRKVVWDFCKARGADFDEAMCEANYAFMSAVETWDCTQSALGTWLHTCVRSRLFHWERSNGRVSAHYTVVEDADAIPDSATTFNLAEWSEGLSEDAKVMVSLLIQTPPEVLALAKGMSSKNLSAAVQSHLRESHEWSCDRFWDAYKELRAAFAA